MDPPDVRLLLRLVLVCRLHSQGNLPAADVEARADGHDVIMDEPDAVQDLLCGDDVPLAPAIMGALIEQAKACKLLAPAWARCGLETCLGLASALQLNGMEVTKTPRQRQRGLPPRGHAAWAQGDTVGLGLYPSAVRRYAPLSPETIFPFFPWACTKLMWNCCGHGQR